MKRTSILVASLGFVLSGCGGECPGNEVEVRSFSGESVEGTAIICDGPRVEDWFACDTGDEASVDLSAPPPDCGGGLRVRLGLNSTGSEQPVIWLLGEGELVEARIEIDFACDEECQAPPPVHFLSGFVEAEEFSTSGRNRGRFDFEFEGGRLHGTYDVTP